MHLFVTEIDSIMSQRETLQSEPRLPSGRTEFDEFQWWKPNELLDAWPHEVKLPPPQVTLIRDIVELGISELAKNPPSGYHNPNMQTASS